MRKNIQRLLIIYLFFATSSSVSASEKTLTFAIVPKYQSTFFDQSGEGCKDAAAQLEKVKCIYRGPIKGDVRKQDAIIKELIDEGVDGIAVAVTQSDFLARSSMQQAKKAGIPIITYDSDFDRITLQNYKDIRLAYVGTNNFELGLAFGEQLKILRPKGGKLLIQTGRPDSPNLNLRIMGLRSALSGKKFNKPPGDMLQNDNGWTEVRSPIPNYDQIDRSVKQLASFLKNNKKQGDSFVAVGGWAQDDEVSYREMIMPYKNKLINHEMIVIISDTSVNQLAMLRDRLAHVNIGQKPYEMGVQSILTLHKIVTKQKFTAMTHTSLTYCTPTNYAICTNSLLNNLTYKKNNVPTVEGIQTQSHID